MMSTYFMIVLFTFLNYINNLIAVDIPSFIHVCHRDDPDIDRCMIAATEDVRPYLVSGAPEFNIPSLEPLILYDLISEEVAGMKITTTNVSTYGSTDYFVRHMNLDLDANKLEIDIDLPKLRIYCHYTVDGKLLLLPVKGDGNMEANITDITSKTRLTIEQFEKDGEKYMKFTSNKLSTNVGGGHVEIKSLFNNDKVLLGVINDVINKNLDLFLKELMPVIEKALAEEILEIANKVVEPFTFKQLFPH